MPEISIKLTEEEYEKIISAWKRECGDCKHLEDYIIEPVFEYIGDSLNIDCPTCQRRLNNCELRHLSPRCVLSYKKI